MRIIPKKTNQKNTVWRWYSMRDILVALGFFAVIFVLFMCSQYVAAVVLCVLMVLCLIPTPDGIVYEIIFTTVSFLFKRKRYDESQGKQNVKALYPLKGITESGVVEYSGGRYARVVEIGEKNFGLESEAEQDRDINVLATALKDIGLAMSADLVAVKRPIRLDGHVSRTRALYDSSEGVKKDILGEKINDLDRVNREKRRYISYFCLVLYARDVKLLERTALDVASTISAAGLKTRILSAGDAAVFLKYTFSKSFDEDRLKKVPREKVVSKIVPKTVTFTASGFKQDGREGCVAAISDYPLRVRNAWAAALFNISDTKVVMHLQPLEKEKAVRQIDRCIQDMDVKYETAEKASEAATADTSRQTMGNLLGAIQNDNETMFDASILITAYGKEKEVKKNLRHIVQSLDFKMSPLYCEQIQGYMCSSVSPDFPLKYAGRGINSSSLAAAFPFVKTYSLDPGGTMIGRAGKDPFILDIWKRDGNYQNSNAMVIGKSGSGKSFFMKSLVTGEFARGTRIMILDPENEYDTLTRNLSGNVLDVATPAEGRINPFHIYSTLSEDGEEGSFSLSFATHLKTLESFYKIVLEGASVEVLELINSLTVEMYSACGITENTGCVGLDPERYPTFDDLSVTLRRRIEAAGDGETLRDLKRAELYVDKFVTGRYSDIWNGPSTMAASSDVMDFTFQSLFSNKNTVVANAQMLLLFGFLEQEVINARIKNSGARAARKTLIVVDEAHLFIDAKYPIALDFFYSMCKRIRKYDGAFFAATQSVGDWNSNEELNYKTSAILKNSQYTFVFKLSPPDMKDLKELFSSGSGFTGEEQSKIISAKTGQMFFIGSTTDRFFVTVETGKLERSLFEKRAPIKQPVDEGKKEEKGGENIS